MTTNQRADIANIHDTMKREIQKAPDDGPFSDPIALGLVTLLCCFATDINRIADSLEELCINTKGRP